METIVFFGGGFRKKYIYIYILYIYIFYIYIYNIYIYIYIYILFPQLRKLRPADGSRLLVEFKEPTRVRGAD